MHFVNFALSYISKEDQGFCGEIIGVLDAVMELVSWVKVNHPDIEIPKILDCHVISRFISLNIPALKVVDGYYHGVCPEGEGYRIYTCAHSWLMTPSGNTILDPYPVDLVASSTVIALPLNISEESKYSAYYGAARYKECEIKPEWWNKEETDESVKELDSFCRTWFPEFNAAHPE